ncbi:MAG: UDP-N-acetylmuramoyl-L-alanyl-D-glutamate--2,6-diaminopimelate ligase [Phycisphaerae bacterium]|jgi:UDP-N-acetylmuramoyl-L-alanyl-D-glutamate--2,6-diaminopimelate ligase|nr:MAG: UDP-N-acetylmuramoyl-L-alanyl-D-glutamate--2,6-diaminopimelate ligase [Phycisphaerae bacterium]
MRLHALLRFLDPLPDLSSIPDCPVFGIREDSRLIRPGELFVARPGTRCDGSQFARDAQQRGAVAIVTQTPIPQVDLPQVLVPNAAQAASVLAHAFYRNPSHLLRVVGVTGTNGKTTVTFLIRHILQSVGQKCGLIGTVEVDDGVRRIESNMTTPGAVELAELLATMKQNHCRACAIETSSHALDQYRVWGIRYSAAGFTNLTGDHLDYHKTFENYASAKARLFEQLPPDAVAAVNVDDPSHLRMIRDCQARVVTFGIKQQADYRAVDPMVTMHGTTFILHAPDGKTEISIKLIGRHNIENALCAIAICCEQFGLSIHQVATALRRAIGAPGRLQPVSLGQPFAVLVDYAHTDDALQNVLSALKPLRKNKLRVVFGCGGDRDRTKRPRMARVCEQLADVIYVTSDNPRTENPQTILSEIVSGFSIGNTKPIFVQPDRRRAIEQAISDAVSGDIVLIAGKGHENYQIIGSTKHPFDDVEEATRALMLSRRI